MRCRSPVVTHILLVTAFFLPSLAEPEVQLMGSKYPNGKLKEAFYMYVSGDKMVLHGQYTSYYESGQKEEERTHKHGVVDGIAMLWYENGQKKWTCTVVNGKREGVGSGWYENGQMMVKRSYKEDEKHGLEVAWYETGEKEWEYHFQNGLEHGLSTTWYKSGQKEWECTYRSGKKHGTEQKWDQNGNRIYSRQYSNGELVESTSTLSYFPLAVGNVWKVISAPNGKDEAGRRTFWITDSDRSPTGATVFRGKANYRISSMGYEGTGTVKFLYNGETLVQVESRKNVAGRQVVKKKCLLKEPIKVGTSWSDTRDGTERCVIVHTDATFVTRDGARIPHCAVVERTRPGSTFADVALFEFFSRGIGYLGGRTGKKGAALSTTQLTDELKSYTVK
jgi:antitoxin component YwqK of YwqJK toxin-antitoxin module